MLTIIGLTSCSDDEEVPQIAEVSDDLVAAIRQGDVSLVTDIIANNPEDISDILNTRLPAAGRDAGLTPLIIAARDIDNPELVKLLINNGADASITTEPQGWTALLYALAFNKNDAVSAEVLKAGNPNKDQKLAVAYQPTDADLLRKTPLRSGKNAGYLPVGATGLILATFISDTQQALSKIKLLTTSAVDLEAGDENGRKATLYAAVHHNAEVVSALVGAGADVKGLKDASGNAVLVHVVEYGVDVTVVDALVAGGLPVDEENKEGYTGLQWAAQKGGPTSADFISKLLAGGADVNKANTQQEGRTALIFAVQSGNVAAVKVLVNFDGIDVGKTDATGKAASAYATENAEIAALVTGKSTSTPPSLSTAPSLTVVPTSLDFATAEVATKTVTITLVNANSWSVGAVDPPNSWLSASKSGNVLTVTVTENTVTTDRTASVDLTPAQEGTDGEAVTLSVTQAGAIPLGLGTEQITFASGSNSHEVTVNLGNAAGSWSVGTPTYTDADDWITVTKNPNTLTVEVTANASGARRSGSVDVDLGGSTKTLSISQVAAPSFGITNRALGFTFSYDQTSRQYRTLEDIKNIDELTIDPASIPDWLRASVTPGNNVQANPLLSHVTSESRSATLRVIGTKTGVTGTNGASTVETFGVAQNGRPTSLPPGIALYESTVNVPATASTSKSVQVIVGGADTWSVGTPSEIWLTAPRGTGDDADKILISVLTANDGTSERSATVTISATNTNGTTTKMLTITQGVQTPVVTLDTEKLTFGPTDAVAQRVAVTVQYSTRGFSATKPQDASWLTLSSNETGIDVSVSTYAQTSDRSTTVTVISVGTPADTRTFTVTQTGVLPALRFENAPSTIGNTAGYLTFTAYMDYATSWTSSVVYKDAADNVVTDSWLSLSPNAVAGVPTKVLNFRGVFGADYSANTGAQRSATVTITATNPQKSVSETFTVVQAAGS